MGEAALALALGAREASPIQSGTVKRVVVASRRWPAGRQRAEETRTRDLATIPPMGWWKIQNTEHVIGDLPLDVLEAAFTEVVTQYEAAAGCCPTKEEWEQLIELMLGDEPTGAFRGIP